MMKKFLSFIAIAAVAAIAFISCEEKPEVPADIALKGITVSPATYSLAVGETKALTVAYDPEDATVKPEVEWTSSNPEVATVDGRGTVTGVAAGTADIVAKAGEFTAKCVVTVVGEPGPGPEPEDNWDYTPSAEYLAETNLWKAIADVDGEDFTGSAMMGIYKNQSTYRFHFEQATNGDWANFGFIYTKEGTPLTMSAGKKYKVQYTICSTAALTRAFLKINKDDPATEGHEDGYIWETNQTLEANTPKVVSDVLQGVDAPSIAFTIDFGGNPAGVTIYIKDIIIEEVVPAVPAAFAGTYNLTNLKMLGCAGTSSFVEVKNEDNVWNDTMLKEYDNVLVVNADEGTVDYQAGEDGAYWDHVFIGKWNRINAGVDLDLSANLGQLPAGKSPVSVDMTTGKVTIAGNVTADVRTAGEYQYAVDWASAKGTLTVPEGSIALIFKCSVMPDSEYTWDSGWAYSKWERYVIRPFYFAMIFAKQ